MGDRAAVDDLAKHRTPLPLVRTPRVSFIHGENRKTCSDGGLGPDFGTAACLDVDEIRNHFLQPTTSPGRGREHIKQEPDDLKMQLAQLANLAEEIRERGSVCLVEQRKYASCNEELIELILSKDPTLIGPLLKQGMVGELSRAFAVDAS
jgi:hypothetical protein